MSKTYIVNGQVYLNHRFENATVCLEDGKIRLVDQAGQDGTLFDAQGMKVVPGFIDTHTDRKSVV